MTQRIFTGDYFLDPYQLLSLTGVNIKNPGMGIRAPQDSPVKHIGQGHIKGIFGTTGYLLYPVDI
jgi:hypothetical protein